MKKNYLETIKEKLRNRAILGKRAYKKGNIVSFTPDGTYKELLGIVIGKARLNKSDETYYLVMSYDFSISRTKGFMRYLKSVHCSSDAPRFFPDYKLMNDILALRKKLNKRIKDMHDVEQMHSSYTTYKVNENNPLEIELVPCQYEENKSYIISSDEQARFRAFYLVSAAGEIVTLPPTAQVTLEKN